MKLNKKLALCVAAVVAVSAVAAPQINTFINKLAKHTDTEQSSTKVVPILSIGVGTSSAIGAAQVTGPRHLLDKVKAVAAPEAKIFGEIGVRALIPVSSKNVVEDIKKVDGVGVSGIVDLKL